MPKQHKMIAKNCPKCDQQMPVACKTCRCGHYFFKDRKNSRGPSPGEDILRRTQRVRREKPNYYDILEYDKQIKRAKLRNSECDDEEKKEPKIRKKRVKKEEEEEDDVVTSLSHEKQLHCTLILQEINRKLQTVTWKPS